MKKRISTFLLALLAALTLTVPAWAETQPGDALIYDTESLLTDGERQQLESLADQITWQYDCAVYVVTIYDYEQYADGVYEAAYTIYNDYDFGIGEGRDGVLLLLTLEHGNLRLRLFDEASCTVLEDYTLDSYSSMPQVVQGEDVLLLLSYDVPERSFLALVREDGQYVPSLRGTLPNKSYHWYQPAVAYRNGHLAFATLSPDEERPGLSMEVWIWEDGGEVFYGRFLRAAAWENSIYTSAPLRLFWKEDAG